MKIKENVEAVRTIVFPFAVYTRGDYSYFDQLLSTQGIVFHFDEDGQLISYEGGLYKNTELWNRFFS